LRSYWDTLYFEFYKVSFFFLNSYRFWDNVENNVEPNRPQMKTWRMRNAGWTPKTTNTHSEYVILIAFPLQEYICHSSRYNQCCAWFILPLQPHCHFQTRLNHLTSIWMKWYLWNVSTCLFTIKPTSWTNFPNLLRHENLHVPFWSCSKAVFKPVWHPPVPSVQGCW